MPVHLISVLERTIDGDRRSPVADVVARQWDLPPGSARWWRSSACHVFVAAGTGYLRLVSDGIRSAESFAAIASLMADLAARGIPVAAPVLSAQGRLVETVETPLGAMHAMLLTAAPGKQIDVDELTPDLAEVWGAALARLHDTDAAPAGELFSELSELDDHGLGESLQAELARVPREDIGLVHGDFELDNLAWSGGTPTAFDFDETAVSWYAADVAIAMRDLADRPRLAEAFVAGYRRIRPLETTYLPLFARAQAACSIVRVQRALAGAGDALPELQARLRQHIERQRVIAADNPRSCRLSER